MKFHSKVSKSLIFIILLDYRKGPEEEPFYQWWDNLVVFDPQYFIMGPNEKRTVKLTINALQAETISDIIEVMVLDGDTHYLFLKAEIQDVHVGLSRHEMSFPELYAGKYYEIDQRHDQSLKIVNYGNIPAHFKWRSTSPEELNCTFEPAEGVVEPKSELPITFKFTPHLGANVNRIFECYIEETEKVIGFEMSGKVYGLSVAYEMFEEDPLKVTTTSGEGLTPVRRKSASSLNGLSFSKGRGIDDFVVQRPPFEKLELMDLRINQPKIVKFILNNTSGLDTKFHFYCENFEPLEHKEEPPQPSKSPIPGMGTTQRTAHTHATSMMRKKLDMTNRSFNGPVLTADIELNKNFTSYNGMMLNAQRKLEKDQKFYLTNNKGVAIVCEPYKGDLRAYQEITITVTVYNDVCGRFTVKNSNFISNHVGLSLL